MLNNVFVISTKKATSFALCLEAAKYGEHVSLIYAGEKDDAVNAEKAYWLGSLDSASFVTCIPEIVKLVKQQKPDPAIYQLLCERYGLTPAECLFVDDNADNCEGARIAGMQAVHYTGDVAAILAALED